MSPLVSVPVLTCAEAKLWESGLLKDEAAEWAAMQSAGVALAHAIEEDFQEIGGLLAEAHVLVLVGKGNNGGDALLAAAAILRHRPRVRVDVLLVFGEKTLRPLARRALGDLLASGGDRIREVTLAQLKTEMMAAPGSSLEFSCRAGACAAPRPPQAEVLLEGGAVLPGCYHVCLDGVFGFQFRPPVDGATAELLAWVNTHPRIMLRAAVDLPSGLGGKLDQSAFRADFTYATGIVKTPAVSPANAPWVGRLRYLDLGFFTVERVDPNTLERVLLPAILAPLTRLRSSQSDKRTYGHLLIVGGSLSYPGAVMLAARAALRSGVGLLTAFVPESLVPEYAARQPEVMWVGCPVTASGGLASATAELIRARSERATALLIGPGLSAEAETLAMVTQVVKETRLPLVLDADALRPEIVTAAQDKPLIVTPHAGEFKRIESALADARETVAIKKGPLTQILHDKQIYWSLGGGPVLARGGSGDMLAGLVAGLLTQQPAEPLLAAAQGTVWHGRAADLLARTHGQVAVESAQLLEQLGPALTTILCQTH